jgi:hypothetical protein
MPATDTSAPVPSYQDYRKEVSTAADQEIAQGQQLVATEEKQGQQEIDLAQRFASSQQPFTQEPPTDQINKVMAGAPWLFALTAIGGALSKNNGLTMLQGLNGMSEGLIKGDQEALQNHYQAYQASFDKWKANTDQQYKIYQTLSAAYGNAGDGKLRALTAAMNITKDATSMKLQVDDPTKYWEMKAKIEEAHAKTMEAYAKIKEMGGGPGGPALPPGFKQEDIDYYARQSLAGDQTWRVGLSRSKSGAQIIRAVDARVPELARIIGITPEQASTTKDIRKSIDTALNDRQKFVAASSQFVANFQKQADLVEKYVDKGVGGSDPVLNRWIQAGRKAVKGDEDVTRLDTAIRGLAREHQRIVTGVTSNAQLHASAQATADDLLNRDMTSSQIRATMGVMREEANNALESGRNEVGELQSQLGTLGAGGKLDGSGAPIPAAPPVTRHAVAIGTSQSTGKTYIQYSDGTTEPIGP